MSDPEGRRRITARKFLQALTDAGIIQPGDYARRVVIDAEIGAAVVVHVERYGDERLLSIVRTLDGVEVRREESTARPRLELEMHRAGEPT